jgi:hypothetical protein
MSAKQVQGAGRLASWRPNYSNLLHVQQVAKVAVQFIKGSLFKLTEGPNPVVSADQYARWCDKTDAVPRRATAM